MCFYKGCFPVLKTDSQHKTREKEGNFCLKVLSKFF